MKNTIYVNGTETKEEREVLLKQRYQELELTGYSVVETANQKTLFINSDSNLAMGMIEELDAHYNPTHISIK